MQRTEIALQRTEIAVHGTEIALQQSLRTDLARHALDCDHNLRYIQPRHEDLKSAQLIR